MSGQKKHRAPGGAALGPPRPQTVSTLPEGLRRPAGFRPRFTFELGALIGDDCTVIGHLSAGRISELHQVWSASYVCALTCKILLPQFAPRSKEAQGLKREATLLKRLAHPNIVHIFGQGVHESRHFLVQEYLHGPSVNELLDAAPHRQFPIPDALKASIHVCAALVHLHEQGYIHRDIKPANILLRGGLPVLVDFDVAYRLQPGQTPRECIGTDPYMAPEQCVQEELSPATDLYGVGAVLYELVPGRWPFEDDLMNAPAPTTFAERYPQLRGRPPQRPRKFNTQLSAGLEAIIMQWLARHPAHRFPSARALVKARAHCLEGSEQLWPESLDMQQRRT